MILNLSKISVFTKAYQKCVSFYLFPLLSSCVPALRFKSFLLFLFALMPNYS